MISFLRRIRCSARRRIQRPPVRDPQHGGKAQARGSPLEPGHLGRYILTRAVFGCLAKTPTGTGGELQLTAGMRMLLKREKMGRICSPAPGPGRRIPGVFQRAKGVSGVATEIADWVCC